PVGLIAAEQAVQAARREDHQLGRSHVDRVRRARDGPVGVPPASVGATLRVVRLSKRTPRLRSSVLMTWLSDEGDSPSSSAAFLKLRCLATAAKGFRSLSVGVGV